MSSFVKKKLSAVIPKNASEDMVLSSIAENEDVAKKRATPLCQDTGVLNVFIDIPNDCFIDGDLEKSINDEVKKVSSKKGFRFSTILQNGKYSNDPVIHLLRTNRKKIRVVLMIKGGGSENLSKLYMMNPSASKSDIAQSALNALQDAKSRGCPPYIIGIGIGRSSEESALFSKLALTGFYRHNSNAYEKEVSSIIMTEGNKMQIGIQGLSFGMTLLDVRMIAGAHHIATLPLSISFQCFQERVGEFEL